MTAKRSLIALPLAIGLIAAAAALAQTPGVTPTEIKIGNINPYSGPASAYGTIGKSIGAYFRMVNEQGGINGRKINYITYDDGYSPPKAVEMARRLVEQDQVALIFQPLGTPSNSAIHKYMNQSKVPQLFVATGATKWNDPKNFPWTMGWQPNYQTEGRVYAAYVLQTVKDAKVGVLYQNDDYGKDYLKGFEDGLGDKAKQLIVLRQSYEVTDPTVDSQIVNLKNSGANVFFNITTPKFAVQAIKKSHDIGWKPLHLLNNVSTSLAAVMIPAGTEASKGLVTALYMKEVTDPQWQGDKGFQDWAAWMKKYYPEGRLDDQFNAYGYNVAMTLDARAEAVRQRPLAREHHAPGGQHQGPRAADAAARDQAQHRPGRLRPDRAGEARPLRRRALDALRRADRIIRPLAARRAPARVARGARDPSPAGSAGGLGLRGDVALADRLRERGEFGGGHPACPWTSRRTSSRARSMASFFVIMPSLSTICIAFIWVMILPSSSSVGWAFAAWPRPRAIRAPASRARLSCGSSSVSCTWLVVESSRSFELQPWSGGAAALTAGSARCPREPRARDDPSGGGADRADSRLDDRRPRSRSSTHGSAASMVLLLKSSVARSRRAASRCCTYMVRRGGAG